MAEGGGEPGAGDREGGGGGHRWGCGGRGLGGGGLGPGEADGWHALGDGGLVHAGGRGGRGGADLHLQALHVGSEPGDGSLGEDVGVHDEEEVHGVALHAGQGEHHRGNLAGLADHLLLLQHANTRFVDKIR